MTEEEYENLGHTIITCAIEVHRNLGPGLLESVYEWCLVEELRRKGLSVKSQVELPVFYKGKRLNKNFIMDMVVEDAIVLELKSVETILPVHEIQLLTYLKLGNYKLGYLLNFNECTMKDGIRRKVNKYYFN